MNLWLLLILLAAAFLGALTGCIADKIYDKKENVENDSSNN